MVFLFSFHKKWELQIWNSFTLFGCGVNYRIKKKETNFVWVWCLLSIRDWERNFPFNRSVMIQKFSLFNLVLPFFQTKTTQNIRFKILTFFSFIFSTIGAQRTKWNVKSKELCMDKIKNYSMRNSIYSTRLRRKFKKMGMEQKI